jgi:RimJ/RimL family protein N-acetyltransferase
VQTKRLSFILLERHAVLAAVEAMSPEARAEVSPAWLAKILASTAADPWTHGFSLIHRESGDAIGQCGFKGPPDGDGVVEIAYGVDLRHQGKGYATEAAAALVRFAFDSGIVHVVRAHTLLDAPASKRVLTKCGFRYVGDVIDPENGLVSRWEKRRDDETDSAPG